MAPCAAAETASCHRQLVLGQDDAVGWAILLAFVIVVAIPVAVCMTGAAVAALLGWRLRDNGEQGADPELIELS